jgi:hypothetical protein
MGSPVHHDKIRRTLARNLKHHLAMHELSENGLAQKIKISQKQVNNITNSRTGCGIDALQEIANVLGIEPWMLLIDNGDKVIKPARFGRVVGTYLQATDDDRDLIEALVAKTVRSNRTAA